ncbi:MAG: type IX secretion system membrane protein PorP/SprF [Bacteroidales bacterium]
MRIYIIILLILFPLKAWVQDPQFSQFYANPLYMAPSFAGSTDGSRVSLNYRDQWPSLSGHFVSYSLSADHFFPGFNSGIGLMILKDQAGGGKLNTTNVGLHYSYKIQINEKINLQPGIQAYYFMRRINFNGLNFADQYVGEQFLGSSVELPPEDVINHPDFATSLLAYNEFAWMGFTVDHLMKLNNTLEADYRYAPLKFSVYGGSKIILKQRLQTKMNETLTLAFNYRNQAKQHQLDIGTYYHKFPFVAGIWYRGLPVFANIRSHDAITILLGYKLEDFSFGYSYDMTVGNLITSTGGAHELSLIFTFNQDQKYKKKVKKRYGAIPCPDI